MSNQPVQSYGVTADPGRQAVMPPTVSPGATPAPSAPAVPAVPQAPSHSAPGRRERTSQPSAPRGLSPNLSLIHI